MTNSARERIFARLYAAGLKKERSAPVEMPMPETCSRQENIERFRKQMASMRTEVHLVQAGKWTERLKAIARQRGWKEIICGTDAFIAGELKSAWKEEAEGLAALTCYTQPVESFKKQLFGIDAGVTTSAGAVADTGAVILWPTPAEPRLLSLVPPVHIALVDAGKIYNTLNEAMQSQGWKDRMPTNALLISGPSKTADIEFTLVFGVHGPKELIVMILE
ncbi:MAG: lactate utilization protein [Desulfobacteraceae bacterium]|nr:MAG: lactate utilization protein [Desulfobacteraceae bacterium]